MLSLLSFTAAVLVALLLSLPFFFGGLRVGLLMYGTLIGVVALIIGIGAAITPVSASRGMRAITEYLRTKKSKICPRVTFK